MNLQYLRGGARASVLGALLWAGAALADDKLTEANMTQRDFREITQITPADPNEAPAMAPAYAHDFNDAERATLEGMHATRIFKAKEWKKLTPEERNTRVAALRETMPGVSLVLTVPKGELWAVPPGEHNENFTDIIENHRLRIWTEAEITALPESVRREKSVTHSDKQGTKVARVVEPVEKKD